jgi:proteasome lid subunit RPN8/RPN11
METIVNTFPRFLLRIPRILFDEMLVQASAERPYECCGLLAGRISADGAIAEVTERYALINELQSPIEFQSEPRNHLAAERDMRRRELDVLAVYHSHPTSAPIPSRLDRERNYSERVMSLIVGLDGGSADVRGWWLTAAEYQPGRFEVSG